eukprot:comp9438_c0_seq1/m.4494 comp9438_c0_seq1/g.4494  ORF comp9438_c0_seq1/g.4494 comp9438_c0_seq1/m.4494 type:complete len:279 (-) comp9438_c0_seq1:14-850(-)
MVRFFVGRKQPGSTVLLSEAHHVVEVPPHMLPPVTEGSLVDMELRIDWKETEGRKKAFKNLQQEILDLAESDYFINTPPALCVYPDTTEIQPTALYVHLSKEPLNKDELAKLGVKYVLEVIEGEHSCPLDLPYMYKHIEMVEGTRIIDHLLDEAVDYIQKGLQTGKAVMLHGLTDPVACFAIAYFMRCRGLRLGIAAEHVRKRLPGVAPNFAFISQLQTYEQGVFSLIDSTYLAKYVMETLPGWDATLEDVRKALEDNNNDVSKAMDVLCPSGARVQP